MSKGGSRSGAGRPASHVKAEHCRRIDVRRWHHDGILQAGRAGAWQWTDAETGERLASIGYRSDGSRVTVSYSIDGRPLDQNLLLSQSPCNYGGTRPWFICPVRGERVAVLFMRGGRFACRHCQRIAYASQSDDACGRTWRRQAKAEAKLGEYWARPKGMHEATHERLLSIIWNCEERREAAISHYMARMMARHRALRSDPHLRGLL